MANKDAAFGLRPSRMMNGSAFMNQQNRYRIASGATTAIFQGDLVLSFVLGLGHLPLLDLGGEATGFTQEPHGMLTQQMAAVS